MDLHLSFKFPIFVVHSMKKIGTYLSVILYLIATTGFSAQVHFCGDEIAEIAVLSDLSGKSCGCGSEDGKSDCCQEKSFDYKVDTKHLVKTNIRDNKPLLHHSLSIFTPSKEVKLIDVVVPILSKYRQGKSPPQRILHGVYRL